ncbi:MAG: hypothetical protein FWD44_09060 [Oscillospiraceae bacterium]|nr:hypothetical protein [Oscillospiraceae bacterium]
MKFIKHASDEELEVEREKVREKYVNSTDSNEADRLYNTLHRFDVEIIDRMNEKYDKENPDAKTIHREHG